MRGQKSINWSLYVMIAYLLFACQSIQKNDSVKKAKELSMNNTLVDSEISHFLINSADAHRLSLEEGLLAIERGSTQEVREHGNMVMQDQVLFLKEIYTIAKCRKVALPEQLSNKRARSLQTLIEKTGADFDKTFMKFMEKEYDLYLQEFERAAVLKDRYVRVYGRHYLPLVEMHLYSIQNFQKDKQVVIANN